jgi:hypothetical protein
VSVRLKIEDSSEGLVATISQRDDTGKVIGTPLVLRTGRGRWSVKSVTSGLKGGQYVVGAPETERRIGEDQKPAA